jgi:hypothetical protein
LCCSAGLLFSILDIFRVFHKVQECELGFYHSDLEALKLDFDEHLRTNPNSEIIAF